MICESHMYPSLSHLRRTNGPDLVHPGGPPPPVVNDRNRFAPSAIPRGRLPTLPAVAPSRRPSAGARSGNLARPRQLAATEEESYEARG